MTTHSTARRLVAGLLMVVALSAIVPAARGQLRVAPDGTDPSKPITIAADRALSWSEGDTEVLHFTGHVSIEQGLLRARMSEAVVWLSKNDAGKGQSSAVPVEIYGEGDVTVERPQGGKDTDSRVFLNLLTQESLSLRNQQRVQQSGAKDPFYHRAVEYRASNSSIIRKGFVIPGQPVDNAQAGTPSQPAAAQVQQAAVTADPQNSKNIRLVQEALPRATPELQTPRRPGASADAPNTQTLPLILPRGSAGFQVDIKSTGEDEYRTIITGGVMIFMNEQEGTGVVDIGADRVVMWTRNVDPNQLLQTNSASQQPREPAEGQRRQIEFYLEGHVEIRQATTHGPEAAITRLLKADQAYYDVQRSVSLLVHGELVTRPHGAPAPAFLRADEIRQTARDRFEATDALVFSSLLPSDPDLTVHMNTATLEERRVPAQGIFGRPVYDTNGRPVELTQLWATGQDVTFRLRDVPFAYLPSVNDDLRDPLGPLQNVRIRSDRIFGTGALVDWNMFSLLGANTRPPNTRWNLETDYMSQRGPGIGTYFDTRGVDLFGLPGIYHTEARAYVIDDTGKDNLGGPRQFEPPRELRDRFLFRHQQEIGDDITFMGQFAWLSDRNFLEQYYKSEFDNDVNQETYVYVKDQHENYAVSILAEPRLRWWVTETAWLPRVDGYWIGESIFDRLTYFARANAGFASQRVTTDVNDSFFATPIPDQFDRFRQLPPSSDFPHYPGIDTARLDLWQELDLPFELGPVKVVPYGFLDLSYYSRTLDDTNVGRIYGGGGVRASIPFTRVFPEIQSDLFNVNGIAHKIVFWADYRYAETNVPFRELPELDRLNDDATDQSVRDMRQFRLTPPPGTIVTPNDIFLATSPFYDPQLYALRRGLDYNVDTLDNMQTLTFGIDERWQTKRGVPGHEHIIDWMTLNTSATWFPDPQRDNFGHSFGLLQYDYTWQIGDRTTFVSSGWADPYTNGARVFSAGVFIDRPERSHFYVGYRSIEPLGVDAMIVATTYDFSSKWHATFTTTYDFGATGNLGNSLILTRVGSDLQVNMGFTYSPLQKNVGFTIEIFPTLAASRTGGLGTSGHGVGR